MAKKNGNTAIATADPPIEALPDYLRTGAPPVGVEDKGESQLTPFLKIVQAQCKDESIVEEHGVGAVVIDAAAVCPPDGSFTAVPVYRFPSWEVWKDNNDASGGDSRAEAVTLDPNDPIAQKAKARHSEPYGKGFTRKWMECLNFIVEIQDGPMAGAVARCSYSSGTAKIGRRLKGYIDRTGADIFAHRMEFFPDKMRNDKGTWFGLNFRPGKPAWVSKADHDRLSKAYAALDTAYKSGAMDVGHATGGADIDHDTGEVLDEPGSEG